MNSLIKLCAVCYFGDQRYCFIESRVAPDERERAVRQLRECVDACARKLATPARDTQFECIEHGDVPGKVWKLFNPETLECAGSHDS